MRLRLLAILILVAPLAHAQEKETPFIKVEDISYLGKAADTDYAKSQCLLDLYYPRDRSGYPTIVWFHGGGLQGGSRKSGEAFARRMTSEGIAVVLVGYRFSPRVKAPVYIEDAAAAVAWTIQSITKYKGDPKRVFVSGHSAGGYLTAMVGLDSQYLGRHGLSTDQLAGLIPIAGQMITHTTVREERGIAKTTPVIDAMAPSYHVRKDAPPCLCFVGDKDLPTRAEENLYFAAAMKAAGHKQVQCLVIKDRTHGSIAGKFAQKNDEVTAAILDFVRKK